MIPNMDVKKDLDKERRNRLSYLALYYAIQGNEELSERIRKQVKKLGEKPL